MKMFSKKLTLFITLLIMFSLIGVMITGCGPCNKKKKRTADDSPNSTIECQILH